MIFLLCNIIGQNAHGAFCLRAFAKADMAGNRIMGGLSRRSIACFQGEAPVRSAITQSLKQAGSISTVNASGSLRRISNPLILGSS